MTDNILRSSILFRSGWSKIWLNLQSKTKNFHKLAAESYEMHKHAGVMSFVDVKQILHMNI